MKLYGLRYRKDNESYWSDYYAFSHEREKLTAMCKGVNGWFLGASDVTNNSEELCYTDKDKFPQYSIVELPFVI